MPAHELPADTDDELLALRDDARREAREVPEVPRVEERV